MGGGERRGKRLRIVGACGIIIVSGSTRTKICTGMYRLRRRGACEGKQVVGSATLKRKRL